MITVGLHGAEFFGRHGVYPEEQVLGSRFIVDISVCFRPKVDLLADDIAGTVNYEELYELARQQMLQPRKLIEAVCQSIRDAVLERYPWVEELSVRIRKLHPPLPGIVSHSEVSISYKASD